MGKVKNMKNRLEPYTRFDVTLQTGVATPVANLLTGATSTVGGAGGPNNLRDIAIQ